MKANQLEMLGDYNGERAIWLRYGDYEAALLPEIGGNLIAFRDTVRNYRFLHEPTLEEMVSFKQKPLIHGIPILFPPNRYDQGQFSLNGRQYQFPVNEKETGNHLHGFFYDIAWDVVEYGTNERESFVLIEQNVDAGHSAYTYFPHRFHFSIRYSLHKNGLTQKVKITNRGEDPMPCLLGFHTSVNAPFAANSSTQDCSFTMTIGERWELNRRMLPNGQHQVLNQEEQNMNGTGVSPYFQSLDNHYTVKPKNGRNTMILTDSKEKVRFVYDAGVGYKQWMIWNNETKGGFFCPEPQINMVNAPNLDLPNDITGLTVLQKDESWSETSHFYYENIE